VVDQIPLHGPIYDVNTTHHYMEPIKPMVDKSTLKGPIYKVDRNHHFDKIENSMAKLKNLSGPVYEVDRKHEFKEIEQHLSDLRELSGPVYKIEHDSNYIQMSNKVAELKNITGPVYEGVETNHQYNEILGFMHNLKKSSRPKWNNNYKHSYDPKDYSKQVEVTSLVGPIYATDNRHSYGHDYKAASEEPKLQKPVYMDGRHSYGQEPRRPAPDKKMVGPVYVDGSKHSYGKDYSRPTPEKTSAGPVMNVPHRHNVNRVLPTLFRSLILILHHCSSSIKWIFHMHGMQRRLQSMKSLKVIIIVKATLIVKIWEVWLDLSILSKNTPSLMDMLLLKPEGNRQKKI